MLVAAWLHVLDVRFCSLTLASDDQQVIPEATLFWSHTTSVVCGYDLAPFQLVVSVAMLSGHMPLREFQ